MLLIFVLCKQLMKKQIYSTELNFVLIQYKILKILKILNLTPLYYFCSLVDMYASYFFENLYK